MSGRPLKVVILAAGKGSRLHSAEALLPKALRPVQGKPMLAHLLETLDFVPKKDIIIVVGFMGDQVVEAIGPEYSYAVQRQQRGTGHAVLAAESKLEGFEGDVMVLYGDSVLFSKKTYQKVIAEHRASGAAMSLLAVEMDPPPAYGRLIRDEAGHLVDVVEQRNASPEQLLITELNAGIQIGDWGMLREALCQLSDDNPQGEYILTATVGVLGRAGKPMHVVRLENPQEGLGVNTPEDLERVEALLRSRA